MRRILALTLPLPLLIAGSSCVVTPAPTAPAPRSFHSSKVPRDALQVAVLALMSAGFRVTQTDSVGQAVTASRTASHNGNEQYVSCGLPRGSAAAANRETTVTINFRATSSANGSGSDVHVDSRVRTSYPGYEGTSMEIAPNEIDCVSNGTMEQQLESAVR